MSDDDGGGDESPSLAQKAVMVLSGVVVGALVVFVAWQLATAPAGSPPPVATVSDVFGEGDGFTVTVSLENTRVSGFRLVTVDVDCTQPPTTITFEFVPGRAVRTGTVRCPANASDPTATVVTWIEG